MYRQTSAQFAGLIIGVLVMASSVVSFGLPIPPQNEGTPYTRSGQAAALEKIKGAVAVLPGSRYAYVQGRRVRLDPARLRAGEAAEIEGHVWVPAAFALAVVTPNPPADKAPAYLADRWVHTLQLPDAKSLKTSRRTIDAHVYIDMGKLAESHDLVVSRGAGGLMLVAPVRLDTSAWTETERDAVTALFDTPEKYADPALATKYIPQLARQGVWTNLCPSTAEEIALLDGPEPEWPVTPPSAYDETGMNREMFGSAVPEPGVWPRLLFSEADLPAIRERIAGNIIAQKTMIELEVLLQKTWLDPDSDDGKVLTKLLANDVADLEWDPWSGGRRIPNFPWRFNGFKPGMYSSHVAYTSQCLVSMALYALVTRDDALGRKAATALVNLYKLQEPNLDRYLQFSDSELGSNPADANGSTTQWRGMHALIAHMDLPFALDFGGKWMTPEQRADMVRIIAKATYGRRNNGGDGPRRCWRDINHVTWHMTHFLALAAIEGLEGFDPAAYESGSELVADFLEWGINEHGTTYESNGKSGGGLQFQILCMNVLARRGHNMWGHPHWRNFMKSQAMTTSPNGKIAVSSGTWSGGLIAMPSVMMFHSVYPKDRYAEFLLSCDFGLSATTTSMSGKPIQAFDLAAYRKQLEEKLGRTRLPGPNTPGFTMTVIYDTDWTHTERADLDAPLDFVDSNQGILSSFSENSQDAVWMNMSVRNNHYLGAGHHHADAGMFHFSANGVDWITESPFRKCYDGRFHNQVLIDGISEPDDINGRADWLGDSTAESAAFASADLTQAYSYVWKNQFIYYDTDEWGPRPDQFDWSLCKDPLPLQAFKGTQRYKMRPWWATGIFANWTPVLQRPYNPVVYVYRTAGLVRGKHPYGVVIDDLKKDEEVHLYQWCAMPGPGVWAADGYRDLPLNMLVLTKQGEESFHAGARRFRARNGDPMLLVCLLGGQGRPAEFETGPSKASKFALNPHAAQAEEDAPSVTAPIRIETMGDGPHWQNAPVVQFFYDRIVGGCHATEAHFKTLLIPFRQGEKLPQVTYDADKRVARIQWSDQEDTLHFGEPGARATGVRVVRDGETVADIIRGYTDALSHDDVERLYNDAPKPKAR